MTTPPPPKFQTAIIQPSQVADQTKRAENDVHALPLALIISEATPVPTLPSEFHVLVRVLAVALNPTDHKMVTHFPSPGNMTGCDFSGIVIQAGTEVHNHIETGTRVCGGVFPYGHGRGPPASVNSGAFAQFVTADSRLLVCVPDGWDDLQGAALGAVGWGTVALAIGDPEALGLKGTPSQPAGEPEPVIVYGGGTATGSMACQLLKLSGYTPTAVTTSDQSSQLALQYGAVETVITQNKFSPATCAESLKALAPSPIRHALDCIASAESAMTCYAALARTGGRYACLEALPSQYRTRRAVKAKEVMGFEGLGDHVHLVSADATAEGTYSRKANPALFAICVRWATEVQKSLDAGLLKHHPVRKVDGQWDGILRGLAMLQRGEVRGEKLVVRLSSS